MKSRQFAFGMVTAIALSGTAGWFAAQAFSTPDNVRVSATSDSTVQTVNGETVVTVSPDVQRASHIEVSRLASTDHVVSDSTAYATVIDLQSYFDLSNRLATARADLDTVTAQAGNSRAQFSRSQTLFDDDRNVSRKSLQDADSAMLADAAKLRAASTAVASLTATMRQQFGDALAAPQPDLLAGLESGKASLLRVAFANDQTNHVPVTINATLPDGQQIQARRLSSAPVADPVTQSQAWFYAVRQALPAGLRVDVNATSLEGTATLPRIPEQAVLWYGGQAWAYVKTAPDRFTRRFVSSSIDGQDYPAPAAFHAGDELVTQGAQLLLSEELKPRGVATLCKDPPECDD